MNESIFRILLSKLRNSTVRLVRKHTNLPRARHLIGKEYLSCDVRVHSIITEFILLMLSFNSLIIHHVILSICHLTITEIIPSLASKAQK